VKVEFDELVCFSAFLTIILNEFNTNIDI